MQMTRLPLMTMVPTSTQKESSMIKHLDFIGLFLNSIGFRSLIKREKVLEGLVVTGKDTPLEVRKGGVAGRGVA